MGQESLKVPRKLHTLNRERLVKGLKEASNVEGSIVLLQGGEAETLYSSDKEITFRQVIYLLIYLIFPISLLFNKIYCIMPFLVMIFLMSSKFLN